MIAGIYCDKLRDRDGCVRWSSGWRSNVVVQASALLLAALMKRQAGVAGILFWALGEGDASWDATMPPPQSTATQLTREITRQALDASQIVYLDANDQPTLTPSNRLEIVTQFHGEDLVAGGFQPLREFGVFGGDATTAPNSGFMVDYVIHPRVDLTPGMTLNRRLRLTFGAEVFDTSAPAGQAGLDTALPVLSIDGVGQAFADDLSAHGIVTLGDLATIDPLQPVGQIAPMKLREFCAKAKLATCVQLAFFPLQLLADRSISDVLRESPADLVRRINAPGITQEMVMRLQAELDKLQVALDDLQLQSMTLGDLMHR